MEIDDTSLKWRVRIAPELYSAFVKNENFKGVITVSPTNVNMTRYSLTNATANGERYDMVLSSGSLFSQGIIQEAKKLIVSFSNIQFSEPTTTYNGKLWAVPNTPDVNALWDSNNGLPFVFGYGVSGLGQDPLNTICSSIKVDWGKNDQHTTTNIDECMYDAQMRFYDDYFLKEHDSLLTCDKSAYYCDPVSQYPTFEKYWADATSSVVTSVPCDRSTYIPNVADNFDHVLSLRNRGQQKFKKTYSKRLASHNYSFTGIAWVASVPTQVLNNFVVDGIEYPTNIDLNSIMFLPLTANPFYYYNKANANIKNGTTLIGVPEPAGRR